MGMSWGHRGTPKMCRIISWKIHPTNGWFSWGCFRPTKMFQASCRLTCQAYQETCQFQAGTFSAASAWLKHGSSMGWEKSQGWVGVVTRTISFSAGMDTPWPSLEVYLSPSCVDFSHMLLPVSASSFSSNLVIQVIHSQKSVSDWRVDSNCLQKIDGTFTVFTAMTVGSCRSMWIQR